MAKAFTVLYSFLNRVVVTRLETVETCLNVVDIATIAQGVHICDAFLIVLRGRGEPPSQKMLNCRQDR